MIPPIETRYAGCRFRSRLEARWAVFFDALGLEWEYEPQGFHLGDAGTYLPDFWLPESRAWFEVKGETPTPADEAKLQAFSRAVTSSGAENWRQCQYLKVAVGPIPDPRIYGRGNDDFAVQGATIVRYIPVDGSVSRAQRSWMKCPEGHTWVGWEWCWQCDDGVTDNSLRGDYRHPDILAALTAARSARFEHGESG